MDERDIERLRQPRFEVARRGYDTREVDRFLSALADWLESEAAEELGGFAVKQKLELAGKTTANILATAEHEAEEMRRRAAEEAQDLRADAETDAAATRRAADEYAEQTRVTAEAKTKRIIGEGEERRGSIEAAVADLVAQRDRTVAECARLAKELTAAVAAHPAEPPRAAAPSPDGGATGAGAEAPDGGGNGQTTGPGPAPAETAGR